jgi:hypothetical protein
VQSNASSAPLLAIVLSIVLLAVGAFVGARTRRTPQLREGRRIAGMIGPPSTPE